MLIRTLYFFLLAGELLKRLNLWASAAEYFFKPSLMLVLGFYFAKTTSGKTRLSTTRTLAAIGFSLLGDIALMFETGFLMGLGAFLVAHVFYILVFSPEAKPLFSHKILLPFTFLIGVYGVGLLAWVLPKVGGGLQVPIVLYALTILTMLLMALNRWQKVPPQSFWLVLVGASLFVLSDSMIAISRFVQDFSYAGFGIMLTYGLGQFLIIEGLCRQDKLLSEY
jgi:uncharacterized membrane protein YhhN